jgi:hypothetical protein
VTFQKSFRRHARAARKGFAAPIEATATAASSFNPRCANAGVAVLLAGLALPACAASVYIAGDGSADASVASLLTARGNHVTIGVHSADLTDAVNLAGYDAVVLLNGTSYGRGISEAGQQNLLDFVQHGGGIALTGWFAYDHDAMGLDQRMTPLIPLERSGGGERADVYRLAEHNAITAGLPASFTVPATGMNVGTRLRSSTANVAVSGVFGHRVVTDTYGDGRIVQFAAAGNYGDLTPFDQGPASANLNQLFAQGVEWAADAPAAADPVITPLPGAATTGVVLLGGLGFRRSRRPA